MWFAALEVCIGEPDLLGRKRDGKGSDESFRAEGLAQGFAFSGLDYHTSQPRAHITSFCGFTAFATRIDISLAYHEVSIAGEAFLDEKHSPSEQRGLRNQSSYTY